MLLLPADATLASSCRESHAVRWQAAAGGFSGCVQQWMHAIMQIHVLTQALAVCKETRMPRL